MMTHEVSWHPSSRPSPDRLPMVELLETLEDRHHIDLVEQLALAAVDRDQEVAATRETLSGALGVAHRQHLDIVRLKKRATRVAEDNNKDKAKAN